MSSGNNLPTSVKDVAAHLTIDESALRTYMRAHVSGFQFADTQGGMIVKQFSHGQSNPTYFIQVGSGSSLRRYVMRKKPPGKLLPSAHQIEREYLVINALQKTGVPVPRTFALCTDASIIGTPFFIMEYVEGRIFKRADLREGNLTRSDRLALFGDLKRVLALIHGVDIKAVGLDWSTKGFCCKECKTMGAAVRSFQNRRYKSSE
jgi:acyl-CoA dehydrogenase